jgi:flagellar hook-associated protein 1 FlgK
MSNETETFNDHYAGTVAQIGLKKQIYQSKLEEAQAVHTQIANYRQSIQGVVLDEELTEMIKFQQAFAAAAKIVDLADEMMSRVIELGVS